MFNTNTNKPQINEDWRCMATVVDRLLLVVFSSCLLIGTAIIILQAPLLYDTREPLDEKVTQFSRKLLKSS